MVTVVLVSAAERKRDLVLASLTEAGLETVCVQDVSKLAHSPDQPPRLVIVDVPSLNQAQVEAAFERSQGWQVPIVMLLSPENLGDQKLLQRADDFILEPVRPLEIATRIRRLLGRGVELVSEHVLKIGDLAIDEEKYEVRVAGDVKLLTYKEYELLKLLASNPGRVFSREELLSKVWGYDYFGGTRTVDVHVRRLRSKIGDLNHSFIETVWNVGYRFKAPAA